MAFISNAMQEKLSGMDEDTPDPMGDTVMTLQLKKKARQAQLRRLMQEGGYGDLLQNARIGSERLSEEEI